jgi:hypothetical protein
MNLEFHTELETGDDVITLRITRADQQTVLLNDFDRLLLSECSKDNASIADRILGLETLCRRIQDGQSQHE